MKLSSSDWYDRLGIDDPCAADLALAVEAALRGGEAALACYGQDDLEVQDKGVDDPVTEADHASNAAILGLLRDLRPDDPVLSEESHAPDLGRVAPARLWIIDPLDGTKEFIARNGEFSVMVGLAREGQATLGAVYQPEPDRLFLGAIGVGAWVVADAQQEPVVAGLGVSGAAGTPIRFVRSRSHPSARLQQLADLLGEVEPIVSGSVGIKCALVALGEADLYVHPVPYLKEWDTCAPEAVLRGAGGRVTDCLGRRLRYGKPDPPQPGGIFAARPDVWEQVAQSVAKVADFVQ